MATTWFSYSLRARYQETDQMGVIYHGNFLSWFEVGRLELLRQLGLPFRDVEARGVRLLTVGLEIKFLKPARYDDAIVVDTLVVESDDQRIAFESRVSRAEDPSASHVFSDANALAMAKTRHVWTDVAFSPIALSLRHPELAARIAAVS